MSGDIQSLLNAWPYDSSQDLIARKIVGRDGRPKVQMRVELGILQMELTGRPDGLRPYGFDSLRDYYEDAIARTQFSEDKVSLGRDECAQLHRESQLYYYRRICCLQLGEFVRAELDADHNLAIMDLLRLHAEDRRDWLVSEQFRPFVLTHRTHARALRALKEHGRLPALRHIEEGEGEIRKFLEEHGAGEQLAELPEYKFLEHLREQIEKEIPLSRRDRLEMRLREAVGNERYEEAARLRDLLEKLR